MAVGHRVVDRAGGTSWIFVMTLCLSLLPVELVPHPRPLPLVRGRSFGDRLLLILADTFRNLFLFVSIQDFKNLELQKLLLLLAKLELLMRSYSLATAHD